MIVHKVNWEAVQNRVSACRYMAESGEDDKARDMLREFAKEIIKKTEPSNDTETR